MKGHLVAAKILSGLVAASLIGSPIIAYAGSSGYVGETTNVFNDETSSGAGFTWSSDDSTLTLTNDVNGNVVADNDITITTNDNVTVSGNIEVSTSDSSTSADLTINNANITTGGSISADGNVKITDSTVSADGINGGKDGKGTAGDVIITDSNVTSTDTIAAGNDEQISSHAQGEYGNHNVVINNSNVTAEAKDSSVGTQYPIVAVGGTVALNGSYISSPSDGSTLNQGYYGTDIYLGEVGRIKTSSEGDGYTGKVTITAGSKPSSDSVPSDTNSGSGTSPDANSGSGASSDNNDSASSETKVTTTSDYANVYTSDISNGYFAAVSNSSGAATVAVKDSNGKSMNVAVDLSSASSSNGSKITATIVPALDRNGNENNGLDKNAQALNAVITESGKTPIEGALFIRAYAAGVSLTKLEVPVKYTFTLDKTYEGKTVTVYVRTVTGEIHSYDAVVTNGKVQVSTEFLGTVAFAM
ncbi:hypothetical protein [Butyrivibrio sp.]|uniref:hypothetical protein n=1 Tax=Butyrivibrio sp. TaxID=28121 RepID=UPI0025BA5EE9|nr:hypothetical protein [Butyrivibrio sp.]MBE5837588.1 hypothetical protein [Butyrivibrio sp.]